MKSAIVSILFVSFIAFTGCSGSGKHDVSGEVTFQGKPLAKGQIQFEGKESFSGAEIINGKYKIPSDKGLKPGTYKVRITSPEEKDVKAEEFPGEAPPAPRERIPPQFNTKTKLKREVTADGPNEFNFKIP